MQTDRQGSIKELFVTVVGLTIEGLRHTNSVDVQIKDCTKIISPTPRSTGPRIQLAPDHLKAAVNTTVQHSNLCKVATRTKWHHQSLMSVLSETQSNVATQLLKSITWHTFGPNV